MIEKTLPLQFVKKSPFTGSYKGMRYRIWLEKSEEGSALRLCTYPEPFAFDKTAEEKKTYYTYAFTEEGYEEALRQANADYEAREWSKGF